MVGMDNFSPSQTRGTIHRLHEAPPMKMPYTRAQVDSLSLQVLGI